MNLTVVIHDSTIPFPKIETHIQNSNVYSKIKIYYKQLTILCKQKSNKTCIVMPGKTRACYLNKNYMKYPDQYMEEGKNKNPWKK